LIDSAGHGNADFAQRPFKLAFGYVSRNFYAPAVQGHNPIT
jgi:hypothetical protein